MKALSDINVLLFTLLTLANAAPAEQRGAMRFVEQSVSTMLNTWQQLTGKTLVLEYDQQKVYPTITLEPKGSFTASEASDLIAKALREQAGIVMTPMDAKRVKVSNQSPTKPDSVAPVENTSKGVQKNKTPQHLAVVTCFNGEIGKSTYCSSTPTSVGVPSGMRTSTGMTCGHAPKISELKWDYLRSEGEMDVYLFVRRFPMGSPNVQTTSKIVKFNGERQIVFQDADQVIIVEDKPPTPNNPGTTETSPKQNQ